MNSFSSCGALVLSLKLGSTEGVELALANALWLSTTFPIHDQYVERARQLQSEVSNVDFAQSESARSTINGWVEKQTKNKVKDLCPEQFTTQQGT